MSLIGKANIERLLEDLNNAQTAYDRLDVIKDSTILTVNADLIICIKYYYANRMDSETKELFNNCRPELNILPGYGDKEEISRLIMHLGVDIE